MSSIIKSIINYIIPDYVEKSVQNHVEEPVLKKQSVMKRIIHFLIHTDPGNDIDDEIACGFFIRYLLTCINVGKFLDFDFHITFSVKTKNIERLVEYGINPFTGLNISNPEFNVKNRLVLDNTNIIIQFHDGTVFLPPDYAPEYIVCIAPGLDNVITESNLDSVHGFSHQGLPGNWNGFNDVGSKNIVSSIMSKGIPYSVTTPFESFETLFGTDTFQKYNIPESLWDQIAQDAFKMIMGRMPPTVPVNVLPMAESLVNVSYAESIGKPGTNSRLALAIRAKYTGPIEEISQDLREWIHRACVVYVDNLISSAHEQGATVSPIKYYEQTIESIFEMTIALAEMGMPYLDESGIRLNYSSDGNLVEKYPEAFEKFKKIGIFTPAYDLIAIEKLCSLLETNLV